MSSDSYPDRQLPGLRIDEEPEVLLEAPPRMPGGFEQLLDEAVAEPEPAPLRTDGELRGRIAIVTGGATGIGRGIALELARGGADVAFNYYDPDPADPLAEEAEWTAARLREEGVRVFHCHCDVRDGRQVQRFVEDVGRQLGPPQILINNAGIGRDRALWHLSEEDWRAVLDTNLTGAFLMIRAVAPTFREHHDGKIVNVASVHGVRAEFGLANYSASKAGLMALTRSAALELGPSNVNVNAVAPGYIRTTRLTARVPAEIMDRARDRAALRRLGDPQDVAYVVRFLCSEMARHITGTTIPVDGGHHL